MTIYTFYKRESQFNEFMSSNRNLNRSRYFRLMVLSAVEIFGTIPLGTYVIVFNARKGVGPWISWENVHSNYSQVIQVPSFEWKSIPEVYQELEMFRWL